MASELSIFASHLREFIRFQSTESESVEPAHAALLAAHDDAEFNGYAMLLFALQFKANAAYRKLCEARGVTPNDVTHWAQIPAVPAVAFKELELTSLPPEDRARVFHSSGTTGQSPSRHFHSAESLALYEESLWPWFMRNLQFTNCDLRLLTPPLEQSPHSSLVYMFETIRRKLDAPESIFHGRIGSDGSWTLDSEALLDATRNTQHATLLLGTAFSFVHLLDFMAEHNMRVPLPAGSMVM
ncbi:MAG TPA: hypothetical protein PKA41_08865, partial [Verrucomicrobiota bacterium]|nr:hypothetical protein [Verrucomicrobiota bacterium]